MELADLPIFTSAWVMSRSEPKTSRNPPKNMGAVRWLSCCFKMLLCSKDCSVLFYCLAGPIIRARVGKGCWEEGSKDFLDIPCTPPAPWGSRTTTTCRNLGPFLSYSLSQFGHWKLERFQDKSYQVLSVNLFSFFFCLVVPLRGEEDSNLGSKPLTLNPSLEIPKIYRARLSEYKFSGFNISCMLHFSLASYGKWWEWISFPSHLVSNHRAQQVLGFSGEKNLIFFLGGESSPSKFKKNKNQDFCEQNFACRSINLEETPHQESVRVRKLLLMSITSLCWKPLQSASRNIKKAA